MWEPAAIFLMDKMRFEFLHIWSVVCFYFARVILVCSNVATRTQQIFGGQILPFVLVSVEMREMEIFSYIEFLVIIM